MKPFYQHSGTTIYHGDCLDVLEELPDASIQCCVTSPPFWGLRDYGTATWEGGDQECKHIVGNQVEDNKAKGAIDAGVRPGCDASTCRICGAKRIDKQLGLEATPEGYVSKMVEVFREVKRVLRDDGTLFLNLGDSYAGSWGNYGPTSFGGQREKHTERWARGAYDNHKDWRPPTSNKIHGLKPKDLCGIPWMTAFALRSDGWYLRSDIIWEKPNPMPESVTDRPTKAHEYIFLMSKNKNYYYDGDAIKEPLVTPEDDKSHHTFGAPGGKMAQLDDSRLKGKRWKRTSGKNSTQPEQSAGRRMVDNLKTARASGAKRGQEFGCERNKRTVWTIATQPFPQAHFAVFPEAIPEICIKAGCPQGGTVLDPFAGAGTTLKVAKDLGCKAIGIELNEEYIEIIKSRIQQNVFDFEAKENA